ncbi:COQ9 family protein [Pseudorhodobacter turbinis]|uniref:COQ9 family protein n=1 Tax=Pseudorhodobacter turbinis TaxID=2500533 RepID=A0A4P8EI38_9RHOB|nr:COQ9 family protein [Pseudorhodobacter turbinis]QCO56275.1 COQ9 family protein [Pseudorhodobacter turbinis]
MTEAQTTKNPDDNGVERAKQAILDAALAHVPFDGWSETTFCAAIADSDVAEGLARALFPRGGIDLALAFHWQGDAEMLARLAAMDLTQHRYSDRVALAVRTRLELVEDKELVRRGTTLFALPQNATEGAKAIWGTSDAIWRALGDSSTDFNWYSKRATLSGVYASTVLFWLGDDSLDHSATWEFLDRRIGNVMQIEKMKAGLRDNPMSKFLKSGPFSGVVNAMERFKMPDAPKASDDLPGKFRS